jgi:hypothetical protein
MAVIRGNVLRILWSLLVLVMGASCFSRHEVARVKAPSGGIEAVLVEINGGATTSFGYSVHIVGSGRRASAWNRVASLYGAGRSEVAYGANLVWRGPTLLAVEFMDAKGVSLERPIVLVEGKRVLIVLEEGVRDPSAPAGGMFFNLSHPNRE